MLKVGHEKGDKPKSPGAETGRRDECARACHYCCQLEGTGSCCYQLDGMLTTLVIALKIVVVAIVAATVKIVSIVVKPITTSSTRWIGGLMG